MSSSSLSSLGELTLGNLDMFSSHLISEFIGFLKSSDEKVCLMTIKELSTIALSLGVERTRMELIPVLTQMKCNSTRVLLKLAELLGDFVDYVGGPDFVYTLLPPLEKLATAEESIIRDESIKSLCKLAGLHSDIDFRIYFVELVIRLITCNWETSRSAACSLISTCYSRVNQEMKTDLIEDFHDLSQDKSSSVRLAAAKNLVQFTEVVEYDVLKHDLMPIFLSLTKDNQDLVRVWVLKTCVKLASLLTHEDYNDLVMPTLRSFASDSSWKVRCLVANNFTKIQKKIGFENTRKFVPDFVSLLRDCNAEVKTTAVNQICDFFLNLYPDNFGALSNDPNAVQILHTIDDIIILSILPVIQELISDSNQNVRLALSTEIVRLFPILGQQRTYNHLLPLLLIQLEDDYSDVCLNILSRIECINRVIGIQQISEEFSATIAKLATDSNWRVRQSLIEYMHSIASHFGIQFFDENLNSLYTMWLTDKVYAVRIAATINLKKLVKLFGTQWAQTTVIPKIMSLVTNPNYLMRMTFLFCINELADVCDVEIMAKTILPTVLLMSGDKIANVRFNVAKTLKIIGPPIVAQYNFEKLQIKLILDNLSTDQDEDVQYFASEAKSIFACD